MKKKWKKKLSGKIWRVIPSFSGNNWAILTKREKEGLLYFFSIEGNLLKRPFVLNEHEDIGFYRHPHFSKNYLLTDPYPTIIGSAVFDLAGTELHNSRSEIADYTDNKVIEKRNSFMPNESFAFPQFFDVETRAYREVNKFLIQKNIKTIGGFNYLEYKNKILIGANVSLNNYLALFLLVIDQQGNELYRQELEKVEKPVQDFFFCTNDLVVLFTTSDIQAYAF